MSPDPLDPWKFVQAAIDAQRSVLNVIRWRDTFKVQSLVAKGALDPLEQWREASQWLNRPQGLQVIASATDPWKNVRSVMATVDLSTQLVPLKLAEWNRLQEALTIPTEEFRALINTKVADADESVDQAIADLQDATGELDDDSDAPLLLADWLLWLPTAAQAKLSIFALAAMYAVLDVAAQQAGLDPPDPAIANIILALAAVVTFLDYMDRS
jgi:hypothetical protein